MTPKPKKPAKRPFLLSRQLWVAGSLLVILTMVTAIRIRLLNLPLERDEGEYAYAGQLILQGVPPYQDFYSMKWPGTFAAYALIMGIFGQTTVGIHTGLILVNLATAALIFLLARRVCGDTAGVVAVGTYALLSISPATYGLAAHATHFVMLFALGGIVLLQKLDDQTPPARVFFAGLLLGLAALMKQSGIAFGLFGGGWIIWCEFSPKSRRWRRLAIRLGCLALGGVLPIILTCLILVLTGVFDRFWLWTVQYARAYIAIATLTEGAEILFNIVAKLFAASPGLWALAIIGLFLLFCDRSLRRWWFFVPGFTFFSMLAVCPGGYFREHYFLQLLPAAGLLAGVAVHTASRLFARLQTFSSPAMAMIPAICFAVAMLWSLSKSSAIFFQLTPAQACRAIYGANPFPESVEVGRYLAAHCPPDARIAVIGSEPEIYFYSHRRSATGYIYTYPLMEPQPYAVAMQQEMIQEIEKANPDYVVYVHNSKSWLRQPDSNPLIFDWLREYQQRCLQTVGLVEILSSNQTEYRWFSPQEPAIQPRTDRWLAICKNRFPPGNASPLSR